MVLYDTHAHLNLIPEQALGPILDRAERAGVNLINVIGIDIRSCRRAIELADKYSGVYAAVGIHPHDAKDFDHLVGAELEDLARHPKVVAIGEMGLDYFRDLSPRTVQQDTFRYQLELALKLGKPIIVHDRDAHDDVMKILSEFDAGQVLMHCFSGDEGLARLCIERDYHIAAAGPVTFANADQLRSALSVVPIDRLLLETDCPYLTPHPYRGKKNEPARLPLINQALAKVKNVSAEEMAMATTANALRFFSVDR